MKKTSFLFNVLLAVVMVFTSVGTVFAAEPPPPVDDQSLPALGPIYPTGIVLYITTGLHFNWNDTPGADKYLLEIEYAKDPYSDWNPIIKPMTIFNKANPMIPPTTATVTTKKPLPSGYYHWSITPINTDVGSDPAGTGQSQMWVPFYINPSGSPWSIGDMWPQVSTPTPDAYSGNIDPKKGEGTNDDTPNLNWLLINGNLGSLAPTRFKVTLSQAKNKWSQTVDAPAACTAVSGDNRICTAPFSGFSGISALTPGVPYTWDVTGLDQPDPVLFPIPSVTMTSAKDTLEYNPEADKYPPLVNAKVTDTVYTNKPTFGWDQPAGGLPTKGVYQIVVEKDDTKTSAVTWTPAFSANITPNTTKIPGSTQVACPTGEKCYWRFAGTFNTLYHYRWNVRILAAAKYGPWAIPTSDMSDSYGFIPYSTLNMFATPGRPSVPLIMFPFNNMVNADPYPILSWMISYYPLVDPLVPISLHVYQVNLKRVSPSPLTRPISAEVFGTSVASLTNILPDEYDPHGLPRGVYQLVILPIMKHPSGGQAGVYPAVKITPRKLIIGPLNPGSISATYDKASKKMDVNFAKNPDYPLDRVKYRILVKMQVGLLWRWVKIGTYAGASCTGTDPICTLQIPVYKPGTSQALDSGTYIIQIQEALKEEGNTPAKNKLWGPFGPLSGNVTVGPF